jgi:electron transfer flavoprotein alpha subunit
VANVLVCVELREARVTSPSLFALGEARRVAETIGATVYALVVAPQDAALVDRLAQPLGAAGADKILVVEDPEAAACPVFPLWASLFDQIVGPLRPRLVVFPAGSFGLQLGPPLAAAISAPFIPRASLEVLAPPPESDAPAVLLAHRWAPGLEGQLAIDLNATPAPAVLTLTAGKLAPRRALPAELQGVSIGPVQRDRDGPVRVLAADPDPDGAADIADTVVLLPPGRAQLARELGENAPAGTLVSDGRRPELLRSAAPRLALLLSAKPVPPALATLRMGPDAHLVVAGTRRTSLPSPLFDRVWLVKRTDAPGALQAAFAAGAAAPPASPAEVAPAEAREADRSAR